MKWRAILEVAERLTVILAAVLALFPLWQFYDEREDRKLDRIATFVLAYDACFQNADPRDASDRQRFSYEEGMPNRFLPGPDEDPDDARRKRGEYFRTKSLEVNRLCAELASLNRGESN